MFSVNKKQSIHNFQAGDWDFFLPKLGKKVTKIQLGKGSNFNPREHKKKSLAMHRPRRTAYGSSI